MVSKLWSVLRQKSDVLERQGIYSEINTMLFIIIEQGGYEIFMKFLWELKVCFLKKTFLATQRNNFCICNGTLLEEHRESHNADGFCRVRESFSVTFTLNVIVVSEIQRHPLVFLELSSMTKTANRWSREQRRPWKHSC